MSLNENQQFAMKQVIGGKNLFVSGPGGVGKSYLVNHIMDKFPESTVLLAPTGIAALNIGGATIHSAFRFPMSILTKQHHSRVHEKVHELFGPDTPVKRIIIDEISMVRADILEAIDKQLRRAQRKNVPFGGLQLIVVGDFYQLPPVVTNREKKFFFEHYDSQFAFGGDAWAYGDFDYIELDEIMRQSDKVFIGHLQKIRQKASGYKQSIAFFNSMAKPNTAELLDNDPVFLCTTNKAAELVNNENYLMLDGEEKVFIGKASGKFDARPSPEQLRLKYGTKIIFTANTDSFRNGETGYVIGFIGDKIQVLKEHDESEVLVEKHKWEEREYTVNGGSLSSYPIGSYSQYPIKHGWAVTIHKSQGMTLEQAVIDLGRGCFASGQLYVALSRLKTIEGMGLIRDIREHDVIVDPEVKTFYENGCRGIGLF